MPAEGGRAPRERTRTAVRIQVRPHDLGQFGFVAAAGLREDRRLLEGIPAALINLDLSEVRKVDLALVEVLSGYARQLLLVEARDWRSLGGHSRRVIRHVHPRLKGL